MRVKPCSICNITSCKAIQSNQLYRDEHEYVGISINEVKSNVCQINFKLRGQGGSVIINTLEIRENGAI